MKSFKQMSTECIRETEILKTLSQISLEVISFPSNLVQRIHAIYNWTKVAI